MRIIDREITVPSMEKSILCAGCWHEIRCTPNSSLSMMPRSLLSSAMSTSTTSSRSFPENPFDLYISMSSVFSSSLWFSMLYFSSLIILSIISSFCRSERYINPLLSIKKPKVKTEMIIAVVVVSRPSPVVAMRKIITESRLLFFMLYKQSVTIILVLFSQLFRVVFSEGVFSHHDLGYSQVERP